MSSYISTVWDSQPLTAGNPTLKDLSAKNVLPEVWGQKAQKSSGTVLPGRRKARRS